MPFSSSQDAIQSSRSELKFEIDEQRATLIREYLGARMRPDPHAVAGGYQVCSVYLDSPDGLLFRQTEEGVRNRFKLRVRFYDNDPDHPAFLEIKRRDGNAVRKQRSKVSRSVAMDLLSGRRVSAGSAAGSLGRPGTKADWMAFQEFCRLRDSLSAVGTTYVVYRREAHVSPQRLDWRVTFDRGLVAGEYHAGTELTIPQQVVPVGSRNDLVFELKFTDRFPDWMRSLVQAFRLTAGPFPKYVTCRRHLPGSPLGPRSLGMGRPLGDERARAKSDPTSSLRAANARSAGSW